MVLYFIEMSDLKFLFFSKLTKFQQFIFKRIHWILTFPNGPTKISCNQCLYVKVYCALIENENEKAKPTHYFVQIIDYNNPYDQ